MISFFFTYEVLDFDQFQPFTMYGSSLKIICAMLLHITLYNELQNAIKMLTFLKRQKLSRSHVKGRFMNIILCSMQIIGPIFVLGALIVTMGQEGKFSLIIKLYVTLGFVVNIDNLFASSLPPSIIRNAKILNSSDILIMKEDNNTCKMVIQRMVKKPRLKIIVVELINLLVNLWWLLVMNF